MKYMYEMRSLYVKKKKYEMDEHVCNILICMKVLSTIQSKMHENNFFPRSRKKYYVSI